MKYLYRLYQVCIALPLFLILTVLTALVTMVGCFVGNGHFWGYYPGMLWGRLTLGLLFIPVKVEGRENLKDGQSYVFVANHQGMFDILLIYGYLGRNFKWMMKKQLRRVPFLGVACQAAHHIFVDRSGPHAIKDTCDRAREILKEGMSMTIFPEGSRTFTGHMGVFRRSAFMLADELQLPVCPLTINGSFNIMPRMRDGHFVVWHPLTLTIHKPIEPVGQGKDNLEHLRMESYERVMSGLAPEYQGFVENPDQ